jgi:hypothetical protein
VSALLEALLIVFFWIFIGAQLPKLLNRRADTNRKLISLIGILLAVVIGMGLTFAFPAGNEDSWNEEAAPWGTAANEENAVEETSVPVESWHLRLSSPPVSPFTIPADPACRTTSGHGWNPRLFR